MQGCWPNFLKHCVYVHAFMYVCVCMWTCACLCTHLQNNNMSGQYLSLYIHEPPAGIPFVFVIHLTSVWVCTSVHVGASKHARSAVA